MAARTQHRNGHTRRQMLAGGTAAVLAPILGAVPRARSAPPPELKFHALWQGGSIGQHRVRFEVDGERLTVETHIDISARVLFFSVFRLRHDAREVWRSGRLVSVTSTTDRDNTHMEVVGNAVENGFLVTRPDGPLLAAPDLLSSNSLWDSRILQRTRLIDVQHGGEVGLVARPLGLEQVNTPAGPVRARRSQIITPYYAGSIFHDENQRWVKALIEMRGETIEYALAT